MEVQTQHGLDKFNQFHPNSKVWVYQADRELNQAEIKQAQQQINEFTGKWAVHGSPANATGVLLFGRFIVLSVDASTPASGCSIDSSVGFVRKLGEQFNIDFFNRMQIAWIDEENKTVKTTPMNQIKKELKSGTFSPNTIMFNNTITTLSQLDGEWMIATGESWLA